MSDQRPEWMPSTETINGAFKIGGALADCDVSTTCACADCLHYRTGLRAQLAVLEEVFNHPHLGLAIAAKLAELRKEFTHE